MTGIIIFLALLVLIFYSLVLLNKRAFAKCGFKSVLINFVIAISLYYVPYYYTTTHLYLHEGHISNSAVRNNSSFIFGGVVSADNINSFDGVGLHSISFGLFDTWYLWILPDWKGWIVVYDQEFTIESLLVFVAHFLIASVLGYWICRKR